MPEPEPLTLDVRASLRRGEEPLARILETVATLAPGQSLKLLATFEPLPLYTVLARKGFDHKAQQRGRGDWEVVFSPSSAPPPVEKAARGAHDATDTRDWPAPLVQLDNRGLGPPEPLVRILEALEQLPAGGVLEAINEREPVFLYPQLEQRRALIRTEPQPDGTVRLLIRRGPQS
ncbi:MAG: DUF2249 domain-containing protein [Steroidobacteraceae bacterium]